MFQLNWVDAGVVLGLLALFPAARLLGRRRSPPPPPGPKPLPLLGNLLDYAPRKATYASVSVFGQQITILNSAEVAMEMLDKKSATYSDRPVVPLEELETHRFIQRLAATPDDPAGSSNSAVSRTAGALILRISHGYEVQEGEDPFVTQSNTSSCVLFLYSSYTSHSFTVKHIPAWFPGAGFQKTAKEWADNLNQMVDQPFQFVKKEMESVAGTAEHSFTSKLLEDQGGSPTEEFDIKWLAASLYSANISSKTVSAIYGFFKAMVLFPDLASDRLPSFSDQHLLPYTTALALEVLRWHSVTPTGVPHRVTEDDIHNGWFIPKGSLVFANIWKMAHDPRVYPNPMVFEPERFIARDGKETEPDPRHIAFGFGRRCRVLADASIFISCAMTLAVFNISRHPEGGEIDLEQEKGGISHPTPFRCSITPRSDQARELIQGELRG
ncbi:cytochrome P450 [Mycena rebaudengoi]|nr:cytochrome P450 [Mycena rebaudengoi]